MLSTPKSGHCYKAPYDVDEGRGIRSNINRIKDQKKGSQQVKYMVRGVVLLNFTS